MGHTGASRKFLITHPRKRRVTYSVGQFLQTLGTCQDTEEDRYIYTSKNEFLSQILEMMQSI